MFDTALTALSTADLLESAADHRAEANRAEARLIEHAQIYADRHHPDVCTPRAGRRSFDGRERSVVLGGDGCPEIAEFATVEFGVMLGVSSGVAADFIGQALALRHRFPFIWARVLAGEATPWRARQIATACLKLSEEAARLVDQRVAAIVDSITPYRLDKIVKAAKAHADPDGARADAEEKARERGVFVGRSDEHGTKTIYIRAGSGNVIRFDATIASIAEALKLLGDTGSLDSRREQAVGIIADPAYTEELLLQARDHLLNAPGAEADQPQTAPDAASDIPHDADADPNDASDARAAAEAACADEPADFSAGTESEPVDEASPNNHRDRNIGDGDRSRGWSGPGLGGGDRSHGRGGPGLDGGDRSRGWSESGFGDEDWPRVDGARPMRRRRPGRAPSQSQRSPRPSRHPGERTTRHHASLARPRCR